jgi:hypothetical protein
VNFHLLNMFIWLDNGKCRTVTFEANKVNIITGDSLTGKTAILDILDYCLFASSHTISEASINERAAWYGLRFFIEGKTYTIARRAPSEAAVSKDYYFSSIGEVPESTPVANNTDAALKSLLSVDFGIDQDAKISYGGRMLKAGSRVSLRYFLLFNTISQDIITHSKVFFDKQSDARYSEALPRTFDLAVGIDTVSNILKREKRSELETKLARLEKQRDTKMAKIDIFEEQISEVVRAAREFGLLGEGDERVEESVVSLSKMISDMEANVQDTATAQYDEIAGEISRISLKIRSLKRFSTEYLKYKASLSATSDSLKPIDYLKSNYSSLVRTSIFEELISALEEDQKKIKLAIAKNTPMDANVSDTIKGLEKERENLYSMSKSAPKEAKSFDTEISKYIFLGETKAKLDLYLAPNSMVVSDSSPSIADLESQISSLDVQSVEDRRDIFIAVMNETTQNFVNKSAIALGDYANYRTYFDYKEKRLYLKKPKSLSTENVGSSSNHMFLHLFMFLGLHEIILSGDVPHVAPFLVIDQFSRPYWGERGREKEALESSDVTKVKCALQLLNDFVGDAVASGHNFQMIVFEHIPEDYWSGMDHVHLVEKFENGNALIPDTMS